MAWDGPAACLDRWAALPGALRVGSGRPGAHGIPPMNLHDFFQIPLRRAPGRVAIAFRGGGASEEGGLLDATWTYGELFAAADSLAAGLAGWGLAKGERVAVQLGNRPELVVAWLALLR